MGRDHEDFPQVCRPLDFSVAVHPVGSSLVEARPMTSAVLLDAAGTHSL